MPDVKYSVVASLPLASVANIPLFVSMETEITLDGFPEYVPEATSGI